MDELTVNVSSHGDPDVGIFGGAVESNLGIFEFVDDTEREEVRERFRVLFSELWDDAAAVTFSDEWSEEGYPLKS